MPAAAPTRIASAEFSLSNKVRTFFECVFSETVFFMGCIVDFPFFACYYKNYIKIVTC